MTLPAWFRERAGVTLPPTRRTALRLSVTGALGWSLPHCLAITQAADSPAARPAAKNVLVILEQGGMSHMDTWDPKPDTVAEHRSPFKPIDTNVPGMRFTELLPRTATVADKLAVRHALANPTEALTCTWPLEMFVAHDAVERETLRIANHAPAGTPLAISIYFHRRI